MFLDIYITQSNPGELKTEVKIFYFRIDVYVK